MNSSLLKFLCASNEISPIVSYSTIWGFAFGQEKKTGSTLRGDECPRFKKRIRQQCSPWSEEKIHITVFFLLLLWTCEGKLLERSHTSHWPFCKATSWLEPRWPPATLGWGILGNLCVLRLWPFTFGSKNNNGLCRLGWDVYCDNVKCISFTVCIWCVVTKYIHADCASLAW